MQTLQEIEKRFLEVSGLDLDLSVFPLEEKIKSQTEIDKEKSNQFGEVFTPLWLVDKMILKATLKKLYQARSPLDLCSGNGQFTIRMMRALFTYDPNFNCNEWLKNINTFTELQLSSCYKILYIFGVDINLLMGDVLEIKKCRNIKGIQYFSEGWNIIDKKWLTQVMSSEKMFIYRIKKKYNESSKKGILEF